MSIIFEIRERKSPILQEAMLKNNVRKQINSDDEIRKGRGRLVLVGAGYAHVCIT